MRRTSRLFELIQILRTASGPVTAASLAQQLEVSDRTIYRDIAALQAMRTPIVGEGGVGYVLRQGYDLPPLNFDAEEIEALRVGLSMLARTGDSALQRAAIRVCGKIEDLHGPADWLVVAPYGAPGDDRDVTCVQIAMLREAIRGERKLVLTYRNEGAQETCRTVRPIAIVYHLETVLLAAWCELRGGFRHFRADRIWDCVQSDESFAGQGPVLRGLWEEQEGWGASYPSLKESRRSDAALRKE